MDCGSRQACARHSHNEDGEYDVGISRHCRYFQEFKGHHLRTAQNPGLDFKLNLIHVRQTRKRSSAVLATCMTCSPEKHSPPQHTDTKAGLHWPAGLQSAYLCNQPGGTLTPTQLVYKTTESQAHRAQHIIIMYTTTLTNSKLHSTPSSYTMRSSVSPL
jgi:hypothetical protein